MTDIAIGANVIITPSTEHSLHARYCAGHFTTSLYIYIYIYIYSVCIQLTLEQHEFELHGSTYTQIFSVVDTVVLHDLPLVDAEPQM